MQPDSDAFKFQPSERGGVTIVKVGLSLRT